VKSTAWGLKKSGKRAERKREIAAWGGRGRPGYEAIFSKPQLLRGLMRGTWMGEEGETYRGIGSLGKA